MVSGPRACWLIDYSLFTFLFRIFTDMRLQEQSLFVFWLMSLVVRVVITTLPFVGQTLSSIACCTMSCIYWNNNNNIFDVIIFKIMWNKADFLLDFNELNYIYVICCFRVWLFWSQPLYLWRLLTVPAWCTLV